MSRTSTYFPPLRIGQHMNTSIGRSSTDRAGRYGKQLVAHLGRRAGGEWSEAEGTGWIALGEGRAELVAEDDALVVTLTSEQGLEQLKDVVERHLVRFGEKDELTMSWTRSSSG